MRKSIAVLLGLVSIMCLAGCGNKPTATTTHYEVPAPTQIAPTATSRTVLGGAIQGVGPITFHNYSVTTFAGSSAGFVNISTAGVATFNRPISIATDGDNLYVADYFNNAIRRINTATKRVFTIGNANGLAGSADGTGVAASFNRPSGITIDKDKNLYVADSGNSTIRKIDPAGVVTLIAGSTGASGSVDADLGINARFNVLNGITTDGFSLYVTDSNNTIRRIDLATTKVTTLAGVPGTAGSTDGPPATARFNQPARLTTDGPNLYVTDFGDSTIRKIVLKDGTVSTIAGKSGPGESAGSDADSTVADPTGSSARFNQPNGITTDGINLYVTDSYANTVRQIVISSGFTTTKAGNAGVLAGSADGNRAEGRLNTPTDITTDGVNLYVVDIENHRIRKIH